jgi:hypothetical protein
MPDLQFEYQYYSKQAEVSILSTELREDTSGIQESHLARNAVNTAIVNYHTGTLPLDQKYRPPVDESFTRHFLDRMEQRFENWLNFTTWWTKVEDITKWGIIFAACYFIFVILRTICGYIHNLSRILSIHGFSLKMLQFVSHTWTTDIVRENEMKKQTKKIADLAEKTANDVMLNQLLPKPSVQIV